jgi:hypothetical protein
MRGFEVVRLLVQEYQQAHSKPPDAKEARKLAKQFTSNLRARSDENYIYLWATCALLNKEPLCRFWKVQKDKQRKSKL